MVLLAGRMVATTVQIRVTDAGPGMPPAVRQRILAAMSAADAAGAAAIVIEAIKLLEGPLAALCDQVVGRST